MRFRAICNLAKVTPSGAEDASYRVCRSHLGQEVDPGYKTGEEFDYVPFTMTESGMYLEDSNGTFIYVPTGEMQCFEDI